jgi:short-subunit dehydrogenase
VLVNNVGLSYDHAEYLDAIDDQLVDDLIQINVQATNKVWPAGLHLPAK